MGTETDRFKATRLPVLVVIAAVVLVGIAAIRLAGDRSPGPLQPNSKSTVEFPLDAAQQATWGSPFPPNPTDSDIVIRSIEPIGVSGLDILGMVASGAGAMGVVNALGFPPQGVPTQPVQGTILAPATGVSIQGDALVGVRLAAGATEGHIDGLRVRYVANGTDYEVDLPYALHIQSPPP